MGFMPTKWLQWKCFGVLPMILISNLNNEQDNINEFYITIRGNVYESLRQFFLNVDEKVNTDVSYYKCMLWGSRTSKYIGKS